MSGTSKGGKLAAKKNKAKDSAFYAKIGALGGRRGHTGGFYANRELARKAGIKGGQISRRGPTKPIEKLVDGEWEVVAEAELASV